MAYDTILSPIIDDISVKMKNKRQKVAGSWKNRMPTKTVPTAPIPVHTAYAVPTGRLCVTFANNPILIIVNIRNPQIQPHHARLSTDFALPRQ